MFVKKLIVCLCCISIPAITAAAQRFDPSFPGTTTVLLIVPVLLVAGGWLGLRYRRLQQQYRSLQSRVQLAEEIIEHAPFPIVQFDHRQVVTTANHAARQAHPDFSLLGMQLHTLNPHPGKSLDSLAAQTKTARQSEMPLMRATVACTNLPVEQQIVDEGKLLIIRNEKHNQGIWYGIAAIKEAMSPAETKTCWYDEVSAQQMTSECLAKINHAVRTPMNAIIGYTEMLAQAPLAAREQRFVAHIHKSSMALVSLFNDIMELSTIESGDFQVSTGTVQLSALADTIEDLLQDQAQEKGLQLVVSIAEGLPDAFVCDDGRLLQVLQDMVGNAIKCTGRGSVELLIEGAPSVTQSGHYDLCFIVQDTGEGIQTPDQQKICALFAREEAEVGRQYKDVRPGLTLCSRLVSLMGGRLELHSVGRQGARFTIHLHLPVAAVEPAGEGSEKKKRQDMYHRGKKRILVVDDVAIIKNLFIEFFHDAPYSIHTASTGEEALRSVQTNRPDLVFMDLNLDGGPDGRDITRQLRQNPVTASIPVIAMTGEILEETDCQPLFAGFLQKPFHLHTLKTMVESFIDPAPANENVAAEQDDVVDHGHEAQLTQIASVWTDALEKHHRQAVCSGRLADVTALATAMIQHGRSVSPPFLKDMGEELLLHVQELNIQGIERLLTLLALPAPRNAS